jgi:hypothetical protein
MRGATIEPMTELPILKIFLSSPGDVSEERALAEIVFRRLAKEVATKAQLSLVIWEHEPLFAHTNFQQQIERPSQCDLVVCILWSRLGTRLPANFAPATGTSAPTGTEFELKDALASYEAVGKPNLLIYLKIPAPQIGLGSVDFSERSNQYHRLEEFRRRVFYDSEGAIIVAHHTFTDGQDFERRLTEHVRRWLEKEIHSSRPDVMHANWTGQPYRGLQSFEAEHQAIFFGRSEALTQLINRIRQTEAAASTEPVARCLRARRRCSMRPCCHFSIFAPWRASRPGRSCRYGPPKPIQQCGNWEFWAFSPCGSTSAYRRFHDLEPLRRD